MPYYKTVTKIQKNLDLLLVYSAVTITLILFPFSFDALIIPKIIIIFAISAYSIPMVLNRLRTINVSKKQRIALILIPILVISYLALIVIASDAPFEQQIFGRTGRGLGFITFFSLIILTLCSIVFIEFSRRNLLLKSIVFGTYISSLYAYMQRFNLDIFEWNSRTNGIIGTLGNPNFQSSLAAMAFIPAVVLAWGHKHRNIFVPITVVYILGVVYICQSTQGYLGVLGATLIFILTKVWFISRKYFYGSLLLSSIVGAYVGAGMLNYGYFSDYLYKTSVQSRGDFWRSALATAIDNPIFGVGLDSFKDYFFMYRDQVAVNHPFAESADNAHNYFLEFAATGGFPLALMYFAFTFYTLYSFIKVIRTHGSFDPLIAALFSTWCVLQAQSIISPGNIVLFTWNFMISGAVIGFHLLKNDENSALNIKRSNSSNSVASISLLIVTLLITYPLFRTDRVLLEGLNTQNGNLIIESTTLYPRSESRNNLVGLELLKSNLLPQSLEVAKRATQWNPNAVSGWGLIVANPIATNEEREFARLQILRLDPLNKEAKKLKF
jgi:O-antigen ligase